MFKDLNIVIGVCGGISSYKVCGLINYLKREQANINIIMTEHSTKFITPLTLEVLSKNKVIVDMFDNVDHIEVQHIKLAHEADIFLIIPASANIIGKVANGIADDMLTTTIMATKKLVVFLPAMNNQMYENKIVQDNIEKLKNYGYKFIEPDTGRLACGYEAKGKLPKTEVIINETQKLIKELKI